jgi:hypothetical protein
MRREIGSEGFSWDESSSSHEFGTDTAPGRRSSRAQSGYGTPLSKECDWSGLQQQLGPPVTPIGNGRAIPHQLTREGMTIVDPARTVTGGVDARLDVHVAAALDHVGGLLGTAPFRTTPAGYQDLLSWLESFGKVSKVGVWRAPALTGRSCQLLASSLRGGDRGRPAEPGQRMRVATRIPPTPSRQPELRSDAVHRLKS